jgi:hypothetical protein
MTFTPETVVYDAIRADPGCIDRLIAVSSTFRRLRNPVLRRVMGRLVTFRDAARIAGVSLEAMLSAVNQAPWQDDAEAAPPADDIGEAPAWLGRLETAKQRHFDARPLLAQDKEPLGAIMRQAAKVRRGGFLVLDVPFDPAPLRRVLARKGFAAWGKPVADDHWRIWFLKDPDAARANEPGDDKAEKARIWQEGEATHIDVRGLEPPEPMLAILREIERPDGPSALTVHHEREPVFLYPELAERAWRHKLIAGDPGEVRLYLWRGDRGDGGKGSAT